MTSRKGGPLLLGGHGLFDAVVVPTVPDVAVTVTVAAGLGQGELPVALPPGLLTQLVSVMLDVRLLLQPAVVRLRKNKFKSNDLTFFINVERNQTGFRLF